MDRNKNNITSNLKKINNIKNVIRNKIYDETFNLENQKFSISSGEKFTLTSKDIDYSFLNKNYTIKLNTSFHYLKTNNVDGINHKYVIFDKETHYIYAKKTFYKNSYHDSKIIVDNFEMSTNNINKIKLQIDIFITNLSDEDRNLELNDNFMTINCFENYDFSDIYENKNNISTNLIKINSNEDDILYNLNEINYLKNNKSTQYLKNVYNILFYDNKTQIDFRNIFYEKVFDVNSSVNDFIEMNFKIDLQYEDISERNYVKTIYEMFDENDNSLYIKSVTNNDYAYFSNRVIVDENIFYNFTKDVKKIKFVIKFQMLLSRVIYLYYIKNDNYRLTIKNYGL